MTWQSSDLHGTAMLALDATTLAESRRPVDPFGDPRGAQPTVWAGDHGFVGGTQDPVTGLTNLGAREYQPSTGRFLNPDPLLDATQPQQWNGYAYSNNNPVNLSDPEGTDPAGTQNTCAGNLALCSSAQCAGVKYVACGSQGKATPPSPPRKPSGLTIGVNSDGQTTLDGIRVQTKQEIIARHPDRYKDSYGELIGLWIRQDECGGPTTDVPKLEKLCKDAGAAGLLPEAATLPDPFGVADLIHCVTKGNDCGAMAVDLVSDASMLIPGAGEVDAGTLAARGATEAADAARAAETVTGKGSVLKQLAKAACAVNSFPGATAVLDSDGTTKPIEKVRVGDTVEATDPLTGQTRPEKVQAVIKTLTDTDFTDITVTAQGNNDTLNSTQHHPYWDATRHRWLNATDLQVGDKLLLPDGTTTAIRAVRDYTGHIVTYNLTVTDLHTYYVMAGTTPVLVHNSEDGCGMVSKPNALARATGYSVKQIKEAIHKVKGQGGWRGIGDNRNPDMLIDPKTGEVHPQMLDGAPGDSIGNIYDYLPEEP